MTYKKSGREQAAALEELNAALFMISSQLVDISKEVQRASRALQVIRGKPTGEEVDQGTTVTTPKFMEGPNG